MSFKKRTCEWMYEHCWLVRTMVEAGYGPRNAVVLVGLFLLLVDLGVLLFLRLR